MRVRDAQAEDLAEILELTSAMRSQLAAWSPVYFRPRAGADEAHAQFLEFAVGSPDQHASVFVHDGTVVGFFRLAKQPHHVWVDDLCLQNPLLWEGVVELLTGDLGSTRWVTCVSPHDSDNIEALSSVGATPISSYWNKLLDERPPEADTFQVAEAPNIPQHGPVGPAHTFGGVAFYPGIPGALAVSDGRGNYAIGSPRRCEQIRDQGFQVRGSVTEVLSSLEVHVYLVCQSTRPIIECGAWLPKRSMPPEPCALRNPAL